MENVKTLTEELIQICCPELKEAGAAYLAALGTDKEEDAKAAYIAELKEDICLIDDTIGFFGSDFAAEKFGAEKAAELLAGAKAAKEAGAVYCTCPACTKGLEVLKALEA